LPRLKPSYPDHLVISYINCSAAIKAMSDIICTSSNAVAIVNQIPADQPIIFAPDRNLGRYVAEQTGRDLVLWQGTCMVHEIFSERKLIALKQKHPQAQLLPTRNVNLPYSDMLTILAQPQRCLSMCKIAIARNLLLSPKKGSCTRCARLLQIRS
jgi:hypothetical protein